MFLFLRRDEDIPICAKSLDRDGFRHTVNDNICDHTGFSSREADNPTKILPFAGLNYDTIGEHRSNILSLACPIDDNTYARIAMFVAVIGVMNMIISEAAMVMGVMPVIVGAVIMRA
jgi:hypothetical protein